MRESIYAPSYGWTIVLPRNQWSVLKAQTKRRAKRRGIEYTLTDDDWNTLIARASNKCEVTGLDFSWERYAKHDIRPMAASLDRIDSSKGYTFDNSRLVIFAANCAMGSWGRDYLYGWTKAFISKYEEDLCT